MRCDIQKIFLCIFKVYANSTESPCAINFVQIPISICYCQVLMVTHPKPDHTIRCLTNEFVQLATMVQANMLVIFKMALIKNGFLVAGPRRATARARYNVSGARRRVSSLKVSFTFNLLKAIQGLLCIRIIKLDIHNTLLLRNREFAL